MSAMKPTRIVPARAILAETLIIAAGRGFALDIALAITLGRVRSREKRHEYPLTRSV